MKRFGNVYEVICDRENLRAAYIQARKGKRGVGEVIQFETNLGQNLTQLQNERVGLPIGNLTSQFFAIYYLSDMDHMIKEKLRIKHYIRYVDDFILLHHSKEYLNYCKKEIESRLTDIKLKLNPKTQIFPLHQGVNFLGFRTYMTGQGKVIRKLRRDSLRRLKRKIKFFKREFADKRMDCGGKIRQSLVSWIGHAKHGNTYNLRRKLFGKIIFRRDEDEK